MKILNQKFNNPKLVKGRIEYIDCAKAIAILLVGVGHYKCPENILILIYTFHMPLFLILSGITFNAFKYRFKEFILRKIKTFIIPWIIAVIINILFQNFCRLISISANPHTIKSIPLRIIINTRGGAFDPIYWFLPCLFVTEIVLFLLFRAFKNKRVILILIPIFLVIAAVYQKYKLGALPWQIDLIPIASVFLLVGTCYNEFYFYIKKIKGIKEVLLIIALALLGGVLGFCNYYSINEPIDMQAGRFGNVLLMFLSGVFLSVSVLLICRHLHIKILNFIGVNCIFFYLAQPITYKIADICLVLTAKTIPFFNYRYDGNIIDLIILHIFANALIVLYVYLYLKIKKYFKQRITNRFIHNAN